MFLFGVIFWLVAALTWQWGGAVMAEQGALLYAGTLGLGVATIVLVERGLGIARKDILDASAIATAPAAMLDGVALRWFTGLYGDKPLEGAAWILWGAGVILALAALRQRREA